MPSERRPASLIVMSSTEPDGPLPQSVRYAVLALFLACGLGYLPLGFWLWRSVAPGVLTSLLAIHRDDSPALDPWGRPLQQTGVLPVVSQTGSGTPLCGQVVVGLVYSVGPNGLDEQGQGDDVALLPVTEEVALAYFASWLIIPLGALASSLRWWLSTRSRSAWYLEPAAAEAVLVCVPLAAPLCALVFVWVQAGGVPWLGAPLGYVLTPALVLWGVSFPLLVRMQPAAEDGAPCSG